MDNQSFDHEFTPSQSISLILTFCSISAFFINLVYVKNTVFGSTRGHWKYRYFDDVNSFPLWIPLVVLLLTWVLIFLGSRFIQKYEKSTLVGGFFISGAIQIVIQKIYRYSLGQIILSNGTNSFLPPAMNYSPYEILSQFQILAPTFLLHAKTNMPGKILLHQFLLVFTQSPLIIGYLIIFISTFGGVLLYGISKRLFYDRNIAFNAFVLFTLIPCKQDFAGVLNTVTPVFILFSLYLFLVYLDSKNTLYLILLGVSLYILVLFEPSPLVMGVLFLGLLFQTMIQKRVGVKELIGIVIIPIVSFFAIYILFELIFSFNLWQAFQYVFKDAVEFNMRTNRKYAVWIWENLKEFFYGAGLPVMMIFIYMIMNIISQWKKIGKRLRSISVENWYAVSLLITFLIVLLIGVNRGETTRLWIYLAVFFQIPAAYYMGKMVKSNFMLFIVAGTLIAQTIITLQRVRFLNPY